MPEFFIYETVPQWVSYRKKIEAASAQEALELARTKWAEIDATESLPLYGDTVEGVAVKYEVELADPAEREKAEERAGLRVRVFDLSPTGNAWIVRDEQGCDLRECFPDWQTDPEYALAERFLNSEGEYIGGGGAAPSFKLTLVRED